MCFGLKGLKKLSLIIDKSSMFGAPASVRVSVSFACTVFIKVKIMSVDMVGPIPSLECHFNIELVPSWYRSQSKD